MREIRALMMLGAVLFAHPTTGYRPFVSPLYPYRIQEPSSFSYIPLPDSATGRKIDYFAPALGSFVTSVTIYAEDHGHMQNLPVVMKASGARHVHVSGHITLAGKRLRLISGDWYGIPGHWREERVQLSSRGMIWHLTISYAVQYRSLRRVMLHMLQTFRIRKVRAASG